MSKGAISRFNAFTGSLNIDGHAEEVAASSRAEERMAAGRMVATCVCLCVCAYASEALGAPVRDSWNLTAKSNVASVGRVA